MLKYSNLRISDNAIPDERTLLVDIDIDKQENSTDFTEGAIIDIILHNQGITCICFVGNGDTSILSYNLLSLIKELSIANPGSYYDIKTAWCFNCIKDLFNVDVSSLDYVKYENDTIIDNKLHARLFMVDRNDGSINTVEITTKLRQYGSED